MDEPADFSRTATKKAVLKATLENPLTMYSAGVGVLGTLALGLFGAAALPIAAACGGLGVGVFSWLINYFLRGGTFADRHVKRLYEELVKRRQSLLTGLDESLSSLSRETGGDMRSHSKQALSQLSMAGERFDTLKRTLDDKLNTQELTYGRYLGAAEQVYLSVLDNLSIMSSILNSLSAIDPKYIASRLKVLQGLASPQEADRAEFKTLEDRQRLLREKLDRVNALLTQNEIAITQMDKLSTSLAELKILKGGASGDLDSAIQEMGRLADQAHRYEGGTETKV